MHTNHNRHKDHHRYMMMIHVFMMILFLAVSTQTGAPYSRIALSFGRIEIYWYAIFILTGIGLAAYHSHIDMVNQNYPKDIIYDGLLIGVPLALIGARLYYVLFDPLPHYRNIVDVFNITKGGLAIHGAILTTMIFVPIFCKIKKIKLLPTLDIIVIGILIGQIVGRFGNFMNHEAYGPAIESHVIYNLLPSFIIDQMTLDNVTHHPTFLYEVIWNLSLLILLLVVRKKRVLKVGENLGVYLIGYGLGRALLIEPMRVNGAYGDALMLMHIPINIFMSLVFVLSGVIYLAYSRFKRKEQPFQHELIKVN